MVLFPTYKTALLYACIGSEATDTATNIALHPE